MARLPLISEETDDQTLRAVFQEAPNAGASASNLYRTLGHSPEMLKAYVDMAWPLRHDSMSSRAIRELMIMRVGQLTGTPYEWAHHWKLALDSGVSEQKLRALKSWSASSLFSDEEKAALAFTDEITANIRVADSTYAHLARLFPAAQLIELTLTASFYSAVARVLQSLQIEVEDGYESVIDAM